jgi:hypothetical protein
VRHCQRAQQLIFADRLEENSRRNIEPGAEFFYLAFVEFAFPAQYFGDDTFRTEQRREVFLSQIIRGYQFPQDLDR